MVLLSWAYPCKAQVFLIVCVLNNSSQVDNAGLKEKMKRKQLWPACLPDITNDYDNEDVIVAGWGNLQESKRHGGSTVRLRVSSILMAHGNI